VIWRARSAPPRSSTFPDSHVCHHGETMSRLTDLLETRSAHLVDVDSHPGVSERVLVRSDLTGTMQLYEVSAAGIRQLTALSDPVGAAVYIPGGRRAAIQVDTGGNERHQLYLIDIEDDRGPVGFDDLTTLTADPRFGHHLAGVSPDAKRLAYVSNRQNGVDFDLWLCDLATSEHHLLFSSHSWCQAGSGFSPDGRIVSILRPGPRPLDTDLLLIDTETGEARTVLPHPDEAAEVGPPAWIDSTSCFVSSNVGSDFAVIVRLDLESGKAERVPGTGETCDSNPVTNPDGRALLVIENRNGESVLTLGDTRDPGNRARVPLTEPGVVVSHLIHPPMLSTDGSVVYYTLSTPRLAGDVWSHDPRTKETKRLTSSPSSVATDDMVSADHARVESFDGEQIPLFIYRPKIGQRRPPVVLVVHGGPESQSALSFNPIVQGLAAAGYAVIVPNVRGSTGYGKRYAALDDTIRRLDSVADLAAIHGWIEQAGLDPQRAALWGGSYGGYMVLAGLAFQPELWAAGVDIVGISDLVTFLENTSDYRRAHREREYGSLEHDREFLASASPLRRADDIKAPLFVIHGLNDPRVPVSEARQLAAVLSGRGVRCDLVIYDDEGHGLARLANRLDAYPRALAFLGDVMESAE